MMAANDIAWFLARLPDAGAEEVYADGASMFIATAFHPPMRAIPAEGGYRVSGQSPLASNCHEARWMLFTALVMDGDQPKLAGGGPEIIGALFRADECEVLDTWHVMG